MLLLLQYQTKYLLYTVSANSCCFLIGECLLSFLFNFGNVLLFISGAQTTKLQYDLRRFLRRKKDTKPQYASHESDFTLSED